MRNDFKDVRRAAAEKFADAFVPRKGNAFSLASGDGAVSFAEIPGDPSLAIVRARVLDMDAMERRGGFAVAALEGNFFWSGTNGGTLSAGADGALWLTERRPVEELAAPGGLDACLSDFAGTVSAWRERSALHG